MQSTNRGTKIKPSLRTRLVLAAICLITLIISIQAVPALHKRLGMISEELYESSLSFIEKTIQHPFSYGSIQPGIIRGIVIKDLSIYSDESREIQLIHIDKLRIGFDLPSLFRGVFTLDNLTAGAITIEVDQNTIDSIGELYVNLQSRIPEEEPVGDSRFSIAAGSSISIRTLEMSIETDNFNGRISGRRILLRNLSSNPEFVISAEVSGDQNIVPDLGSISGRINASGRISNLFTDLDANLHVVHLDTEIFSIHNQDFGIQLSPDDISIRRRSFRDPVEIQAYIGFNDPQLQVTISAEEYRFAPLVHFHGSYNWLNFILQGSFSGDASARLDIANDRIHYDVNMRTDHSDIFLPGPLLNNLVASGTDADIMVQFANIVSPFGTIQYEGRASLYPELDFSGRLLLRNIKYNDLEFQRLSFAVSTRNRRIQLIDPAPQTPYGRLGRFSVELSPDSNWNFLARAELFLDEDLQQQISMQGMIPSSGEMSRTPLRYSIKNLPLDRVQQVLDIHSLPVPEFIHSALGQYQLQSSGIVFLENENYRLFAPKIRIEDTKNINSFAALELHASNSDFEIRNLHLSMDDFQVRGTAGIQLGDRGVEITTDLNYRETEYRLRADFRNNSLYIQGNHGLTAAISFMDHGSYFQLGAEDFPMPQADGISSISLSALGYYVNQQEYFIRTDLLQIKDIHNSPIQEFSTGFRLTNEHLQISRLNFTSDFGDYSGSAQADYTFDPDNRDIASAIIADIRASLRHSDGNEAYELDAEYNSGDISGNYSVQQFPFHKFVDEELIGTASASGYIEGTIRDPILHMDLILNELRYQSEPLIGSASFSVSREQIAINQLNMEFEGIFIDALEGVLSIPSRTISLESRGRITNWGTQPISFETDAEGSFSDLGIQPAALLHPDFSISGSLNLITENDPAGSRYRFRAGGTEAEQFILQAGINGEGIYLIAESDGSFEFDLFNPIPLQAQGFGSISGGQLNLDIPQLFIDLSDVRQHLEYQEFAVRSGTIQGSIRLTGSPRDPDMYGTLQLNNLTGVVDLFPDEIFIPRANLVFEERSIRLPPSILTLGSSRIEASGGLQISRFTVEEYQFHFQSQPDQWILVDYDFGPISVRGSGLANILISGTQNQISLSGNITAANTAIVIVPDFTASADIESTTNIITDLTFTTARGVEFFWPSQQVPILRTFARTGESIRLQSESIDSFVSLVGSINIQGGELFYFQRSFYLREGAIIFDESMDSFDPRLSITAQIREVSDTGPVTISLVADQNPLSQFAPRFTSSPTMSETEILTLLGQNVIGYRGSGLETDQTTAGTFTLNVLDTVGQLAVSRTIESRVREALQLDMFSVRTPLLQNIGSPLDTATPSLGQYLDNTSIFLGRYIGNDIFGELLIQLNARDIYSSELRTLGDIDIDAELRLDFSTPYFDFEWSFAPQNWDKLLIPDNQFSFSWGFSY
ncbi:translocation/assembly module TamB domain-containing protein [Spirochaeta dissipatitropha]